MVRVHHKPLKVLAVSRFIIPLNPMLKAAIALVPIPVDAEARDAVLNRPLNLPVDRLRIALVEPTEKRLALRTCPGNDVPL